MEHPFYAHHNPRTNNNNNNNNNNRSNGRIMSSEESYNVSVRGGRTPSTYSNYTQPIHNFFRSLNPYHYHRSRRHRSDQQQPPPQQQQLPLQQQQQQQQTQSFIPPTPSNSPDAANGKKPCHYELIIQLLLLVVSVGSMCISGFLFYQYLYGEPKCVVPEQYKSHFDGYTEESHMRYGGTPWAHVKITRAELKANLVLGDLEGLNITQDGMGLRVSKGGMYYIYISVTGTQPNQPNKAFAVEVYRIKHKHVTILKNKTYFGDEANKKYVDKLFQSIHAWCERKICPEEETTLSNGGLFTVQPEHRIFISASAKAVHDGSFFGMFMVAPDN